MPDPFLDLPVRTDTFAAAQRVATFHGGVLTRKGDVFVLEFSSPRSGQVTVEIDCAGYPGEPPDARIVPKKAVKPSTATQRRGRNAPPRRTGLCIAGTRTYQRLHHTLGQTLSPSQLVEVVILYLCGQASVLRGAAGRGKQ